MMPRFDKQRHKSVPFSLIISANDISETFGSPVSLLRMTETFRRQLQIELLEMRDLFQRQQGKYMPHADKTVNLGKTGSLARSTTRISEIQLNTTRLQ